MKRTIVLRSAIATAAVATMVVGCGSSSKPSASSNGTTGTTSTAPSAAAGGDLLVIKGFAYNNLTVKPGATVTVENDDSAPHTATAKDHSFDSGTVQKGTNGSFTAPTQDGTYDLICSIHSSMAGKLTVAG